MLKATIKEAVFKTAMGIISMAVVVIPSNGNGRPVPKVPHHKFCSMRPAYKEKLLLTGDAAARSLHANYDVKSSTAHVGTLHADHI